MKKIIAVICLFVCIQPVSAQETDKTKPAVTPIDSGEYFRKSVEINKNVRKKRQLDIDTLLSMLQDKDTILIDVRGDGDFKQAHIKGATHLSMSDIKPETLQKLIPSTTTRVILYCDAGIDMEMTRNMPLSAQAFPEVYQYGYTNLYEVSSRWSPSTGLWKDQAREYLKIPLEGDENFIGMQRKSILEKLQRMGEIKPIASDEYFKKAEAINEIRKTQMIDPATLLVMIKDKNTVLLDVRGDSSFRDMHIRGATHLSLADMTPQTLAKAIPSKDTRVILYCDYALVPFPTRRIAASTQAYPLVYQHGYTKLYELKDISGDISPKKEPATVMRKEYMDYLNIPFEGDNQREIDYNRNYVKNCLAGASKCSF